MPAANSETTTTDRSPAVRWFGRLQLLRLLGKSERTSSWRVEDPRSRQELLLVLPRSQPATPQARERWLEVVQRAARLNHPQLAATVDIGVQDGWPFAVYDPRDAVTLGERLPAKGLPGAEAAGAMIQIMQGLAFAHEAGVAHHDLQLNQILVGDNGAVRVAGVGVAAEMALRETEGAAAAATMQAGGLRTHRDAAERDVLAAGVLLHQLLTGQRPLDETDIGRVIARLPPLGREMMRLPFATAHPIAEPLRAIANRATDRQERQRYRNARTLLQALDGWQATDGGASGGTLAVLTERVRHGGVMPSSPGVAARAARLAMMAQQHNSELSQVVLDDPGLSFEMLRQVNAVQARNGRMGSGDPVLTMRRAIALLGLEGVRRAALGLRDWPGTLGDEAGAGAGELLRLVERCKRAGRVAKALQPAGYDGEVVYLVALLQNLGRLLVHYHFADEAQQIRRLMQPAPSPREGEPEEPGMNEESAAYAVLGTDIEGIGAAVARQWGFDDSVLNMIRRPPLATAVHSAGSDYETLRAVAGCANEAVDALAQPAQRVAAALQRVLQRYGRLLNIGPRELHAALQGETPGAAAEGAGPGAQPAAGAGAGQPPPAGRA
jgi:non-specific serine/threonine protein kinase